MVEKNLASTLTRSERLAMIERVDSELDLSEQADLLSISHSSLYYRPVPLPPEEVTIKHVIDEIYTVRPFYGSRRLMIELRKKGFTIARKTVPRYMHEMGIVAVFPGPDLSRRALQHRVYPYLLRNVKAADPNHIWGIYSTNDDYSGEHLTGPTLPTEFTSVTTAPVCIKRHVVVGAASIVLPGVTFGEGSACGALSLIKEDVSPFTIVAGVPARAVKTGSRKLLELEAAFLLREQGGRTSD